MKHLQHENPVCVARTKTEIRDLGFMGYREAHETQLQCVEQLLQNPDHAGIVLITEHPSVFTLGRKGETGGFLLSQKEILDNGADIIHTERGGDITYHGPGQLVVYPIINLYRRKLSVTRFIHLLEDIMFSTAADFKVSAVRDERNRGIWVGNNKLGSVGIRVRRGITFHGLALNVNLDLDPFSWIQPCGLTGVGMTSLEKERGKHLKLGEVKERMKSYINTFLCE